MTLRLIVPGRPPTQNALKKMNPGHRRTVAREWKAACAAAVADLGPPPEPLLRVHVAAWTILPDHRSMPDADAHATAVKWLIDELVRAEWMADDGYQNLFSVRLWRPMVCPAGHRRHDDAPAMEAKVTYG